MKRIICIGMLLSFFLIPIHSEEPSISFYIYSQDHQPIEGALFQVYLDGDIYESNLESDATGLVKLKDLPSGTYTILQTASVSGYEIDEKRESFYYEEGAVIQLDDYINTQKEGKVTIQIVDEKDHSQADYAFSLWDEQHQIKRDHQTDDKGYCILEHLALQSYLIETKGQSTTLNVTDDNYDRDMIVKIHTKKVMPFTKKKDDHSLFLLSACLCLCAACGLGYLYHRHDFDFLKKDLPSQEEEE